MALTTMKFVVYLRGQRSQCWYSSPVLSLGNQTLLHSHSEYVSSLSSWLLFHCHNMALEALGITSISSVQFISVAQSCPTLWDPMNRSMPGFPIHHHLLEFTQTHVHRVGDAIQPSHPLLSPFPPALNPSQNQGLFQWGNSSNEVAKVLAFQLQHQSFQWTPRTGLL